MNERIRELAEQAENYAYNAVVGGSECQEAFTKKFAELIVRECVTKMALEVMNNSWIDDAVKNTYEHFGVE